ncbi:MAG TPA: FAD-binding oxidoreductase [Acidimicrobiia bacterium]|nr:FAD-binding oxidoreductase [Acidimicrobiia bacterium]
MSDAVGLVDELATIVGSEHTLTGDAISDNYAHDEALTVTWTMPAVVARPGTTAQVAAILRLASAHDVPVTARGSGTGLSGACAPEESGIVVSFERMNRILEIDDDNHVAVVEPGVTLEQLDAALAPHGLVYPVFPGEYSASIGGNVATNAGGMRAVKYGVTRHHVIGLEVALVSGDIIRTGGKIVKTSTGYDLTQLIVGSEGTLALVTEATLRLYPRAEHQATVLAPFPTVEAVTAAVPRIVGSGIGPLILEYIDVLTMTAMTASFGVELGVAPEIKETALAYLVVMMEQTDPDRLDGDVARLAGQLAELGALDVYVLPPQAATELIDAREKAFWLAKANGADDIVDVVVPRAAIPAFMARVAELAETSGSWIAGCGHAGDGNVHLGVFQPDETARHQLLHDVFAAGMALGGVISGEHGIGREKQPYLAALEDPVKLDLMRRIKTAFDPSGILNPGKIFT